jgi:hypothetical protein
MASALENLEITERETFCCRRAIRSAASARVWRRTSPGLNLVQFRTAHPDWEPLFSAANRGTAVSITSRGRRLIGLAISILLLATTHLVFLDGIEGAIAPLVFPTRTDYAPGYSDRGFRRVREGLTKSDVHRLLGAPVREAWDYEPISPPCGIIWLTAGHVASIPTKTGTLRDECHKPALTAGMSSAEVTNLWGVPPETTWLYSESRVGDSYRERIVRFKDQTVSEVVARFYID